MVMLLTLRGSVCIYQGEELGLTEAELQYEDLVDPYGITFWPEFKGRDGCRTPMVWHHKESHGGFSDARPWLPVYDEHYSAAVALQHAEENSVLTAYRAFLGWRRTQPVILKGDIEFLDSPKDTLVFTRSHGKQTLLVALNLSNRPATISLSSAAAPVESTPEFIGGQWQGNELKLEPWGSDIARL
jgi:alpha-glucosidase